MRKIAIILAASAASLMLAGQASAQYDSYDHHHDSDAYARGYNEGYRDGYRSGYDDGRAGNRYDDSQYDDNGQPQNYDSSGYRSNYDPDRMNRWNHRYSRSYSYNDDVYYQQCRNSPDPAGVIAGALIGGLIGNAVGHGGARAGTTVAGVIIGGAAGAAITSNMSCDDRSYAYHSYADALNSGDYGRPYRWRNASNGDYGQFRVENYYSDPDGFQCAVYTQSVYTDGRSRTTRGHVCRQPDGNWAFID